MRIFRGGGLELYFNPMTFGVERLAIKDDASRFSWVKGKSFALPSGNNFLVKGDFSSPSAFQAEFQYFSDITVKMTVDEWKGAVRFSYLFKNEGKKSVDLEEGDLGVYFPFNDVFDLPEVTLKRRVHSFLRAEGATYVYNARVSGEAGALSLVQTKGTCFSFVTDLDPRKTDRGEVALSLPIPRLEKDETYLWEFLLFYHESEDAFYQKAEEYGLLTVRANALVLREGEELRLFSGEAKEAQGEPFVIPFTDGICRITVKGEGERVLKVTDGERTKTVRYFVLSDEVVSRRKKWLIDLYSVLKGEGRKAFSAVDHSTGAPCGVKGQASFISEVMPLIFLLSEERAWRGEGVESLLTDALSDFDKKYGSDKKKRSAEANDLISLVKYEEYLRNGEVVSLMESAATASEALRQGARITPAGRIILSLRKEGKEAVARELSRLVTDAADALISAGNKGAGEKVFSPTALCGALFLLSDAYLLSEKEYYLMNAQEHLAQAEAFCHPSCDYRTNEMPLLLGWDDRLGVRYEMAPYVDAAFFALAFERYARASGETKYQEKAAGILRTLATLFSEDGSAVRGRAVPASANALPSFRCEEISYGEDVILYLINLLFSRV